MRVRNALDIHDEAQIPTEGTTHPIPERRRVEYVKQLTYRSCYRGCKETDILLGGYACSEVRWLSGKELRDYEKILESDDSDIYGWLSGRTEVPGNINGALVGRIRTFLHSRHQAHEKL